MIQMILVIWNLFFKMNSSYGEPRTHALGFHHKAEQASNDVFRSSKNHRT